MTHVQKPIRSLLLGLLAIGIGALAQNFLTSRPFIADALFLFGVGAAFLVLASPGGGVIPSGGQPVLKGLRLGAQLRALVFVAVALALTFFAFSTLKKNVMTLQGWYAFLASLLFLVLGARAWDRSRGLASESAKTPPWEVAAVILITLVAAFMRLPGLESLPFGVWYDEAMNGLDSIPVADGKAFPVYFEANFGRAALSFYVNAFFFKLIGINVFALRLAPALIGVLTIPVFYKLLRQFFGPHMAIAGAFLLAVSRWHITFSRVAFDAVFLPLFACASIYFLARGFRTKKTLDFAIGGLALGFGLHTYMAARLFPVVILLYLAHKLVFEFRSYRSVLPGLVAFGLAAFLAAAPLLKYASENQKAFTARTDTASVFAGKSLGQGQLALQVNAQKPLQTFSSLTQVARGIGDILKPNIQKHLLMFNVRGDPNGRHNLPGEPMLDQFTAFLFVLGAGYSLWNWRRPPHFFFIATFAVLIMGGILSVEFEAPQALRAIGVIPAVFAFAAMPLGLLLQSFARIRTATSSVDVHARAERITPRLAGLARRALAGRPLWAATGSLAVLLSLAWIGNVNHFNYFTRQASGFASWNAFSTAETLIAYRLRELKAQDYDIFVSSLYAGHPSIRFLTPNPPRYEVFDVANGIPLRTQRQGVAVLLEPQYLGTYNQLKKYYPGGSFEEVTNKPYKNPPSIFDVRIGREEIAKIQGLNGALYEGEEKDDQPEATGKKMERMEFDWGKGSELTPPYVGEWQGTIYAPQYGSYQFAIEGTARATLLLDESPLVDTEETPKTQATLAKGNHSIRLTVNIAEGDEKLQVKWQIPGGQMSVIDSNYLYVPPVTNNGLLGKYYRSLDWQGAPAFTQVDPSIAFYFHLVPLPRPYSVEWTGKLYVPTAGRYALGTESISGSQLWIDGRVVVDNKINNQYLEAPLNLEAGLHDITIRFQDKDSHSHVYLYWTPPGKGRQLVPSEYLFPPQGSYPPPSAIPTPVPEQAPKVETAPAVASPTPGPQAAVASKRVPPLLEIGRRGSGDGEFNEPRDLVVDGDGSIYVVDTGNTRVQKFGPDGKFLAKWGKRGNGDGDFQEPVAIVIDSKGQVLVLDSGTGWVQRFDGSGKFLGKFAGPQAQTYHPRGLSVDAKDNVYIADTGGGRIVIFRASGELVGTLGARGSGDGQFLEPVDAAVLEDGSILVSDVANKRIQKFSAEQKYVAQWRVPDAVAFNGGHLAVSPDGSIFATEPEKHQVVRYDPGMTALGAIGERGEGPGQLRQPVGVFVDHEGNLFVADTYNHRVQKFPTME